MLNILGINISDLGSQALRNQLKSLLTDGQSHYLVTPNPEIILTAQEDEELFYILNQADLAPADGFGLSLAARLMGKSIQRWPGSDLVPEILQEAVNQKWRVLILNWQEGLSRRELINQTLKGKFPSLDFMVIDAKRDWSNSLLSPELLQKITDFSPRIIFCTFGSPYQEKIIYHNFLNLKGLSLSIGVGGALDFLSGKTKRAPLILRRLGLEWLWRLIQQPGRYPRIYRATCVFAWKIIKARFVYPFLYRSSVSCLIYKKEADTYKILLVERRDEAEHWQLPQGGTDGESPAQAAKREIREELNIINIEEKKVIPNLYRYQYDLNRVKDRSDKKLRYNYKGQRQSLYIARFTGSDEEIKINFWDHRTWAWVDTKELLEKVHPVRRPGAKIFLEKFKSLNL